MIADITVWFVISRSESVLYFISDANLTAVHTGDHHLLNISITERVANEDECLIVANDGIWDAISDDMACRVASTCLAFDQGGDATAQGDNGTLYHPCDEETHMFFSSKSNSAAALLCRLALGRGSHGNICVIVVDLHSG